MKKFFAFLCVFLLVAAGLGYLFYPLVSDQLCQRQDADVLAAYRRKTAAMDVRQLATLFEDAAAYNEMLEEISAQDLFTAATPRTSRDYQNRVNIHEGVMAELVIPKIGIMLPVYHNSSEHSVDRHLVHLESSSLPTDQAGTSIVLAGPGVVQAEGVLGQIGLTDARMLEDLDRLIPGDLLILNVADRTMVYRVGEVQTVSPSGLRNLNLSAGDNQERLTLMTRRGDRRLVVESERIRISEARNLFAPQDVATFPEPWQNVLLIGSPVLIFGFLVMWIIERFKKHAYLLPGEGRNAARREEKSRKKLDKLSTEPVRVKEHEKKDTENPVHDAGHHDPAAGASGKRGGQ